MKVQVKGGAAVTLTKSDFLAQGGEGAVYVKGQTAFKIYLDPKKMIPEGKIAELSAIADDNVIRPKDVVLDAKGEKVGYTMRFAPKTYALCQLFPRTFREREGVEPQHMVKLVQNMRERVAGVHRSGVLIVDLNEMNVLVSEDFSDTFWIDADSYQTRSYPATAIMPSVRDWTVQGHDFTENSDWFSFACVAFQLFVGIHPYKGKHPSVKGLDARMQQGISVFNAEVGLPRVCYPFDVIPQAYYDWFKAVLEDGKRVAPPVDMQGATVVLAPSMRVVIGGAHLEFKEIRVSPGSGPIYQVRGNVIRRGNETFFGNFHNQELDGVGRIEIGEDPRSSTPVVGYLKDGVLKLATVQGLTVQQSVELPADEVSSYDGRMYARVGERVMELKFSKVGNRVMVSSQVAANVMPLSTKLFSGCAIQSVGGTPFVSLFPKSGMHRQIKVPELVGYKVIEAKYDLGVMMVLAANTANGRYDRLVFRFADEEYDLRIVEDVGAVGINFVTLDSGVCVCLTEAEELEVFSSRPGSKGMRVVQDDDLGADLTLVKRHGKVACFKGDTFYSMQMK